MCDELFGDAISTGNARDTLVMQQEAHHGTYDSSKEIWREDGVSTLDQGI
jgi:hypothetical protein